MKKIAIYGAGGFGKEVACVIDRINAVAPSWEVIGFFDDGVEKGTQVSVYGSVIGGMVDLNTWEDELAIVFAIGSPNVLQHLAGSITNPKISFPNIIHPEAFVADERTLTMGVGNVVVRGCSFSVDVVVGDFNQFNSISALGHDVQVGSFNVFMPLTRISGGAKIGDLNFFGIGAIVLQGIKIGCKTKIGASSVVFAKTKDESLYLGNPAKRTTL